MRNAVLAAAEVRAGTVPDRGGKGDRGTWGPGDGAGVYLGEGCDIFLTLQPRMQKILGACLL